VAKVTPDSTSSAYTCNTNNSFKHKQDPTTPKKPNKTQKSNIKKKKD
jgi:hypothetical protein